jgi:hypothetical protein
VPERSAFDYAVVRVVPHVEREEFINVGIILFCRTRRFLRCRIELDAGRLLALAPDVDVAKVQEHLDLFPRICAGGDQAGPLGELNQSERFHWLTSPRSTIVQISPVHPGLCCDPGSALDELFEMLVR